MFMSIARRKERRISLRTIQLITIGMLFLYGCADHKESIDINLPEVQRIEDTKVGWWIKELGLNYDSGYDLTKLIHSKLPEVGVIEYSYIVNKQQHVNKWIIKGKSQAFKIEEYVSGSNGGIDYYYEIHLTPDNVTFSYLIGEMALQLKPGPYKSGVVYMRSQVDRARLILYGDGVYCKKMALISGV